LAIIPVGGWHERGRKLPVFSWAEGRLVESLV
jgi:hypothetical protein